MGRRRRYYPRHDWSPEDDALLLQMCDGTSGCLQRASAAIGCSEDGAKARILKLRRVEGKDEPADLGPRIERPAPGVLVHRLLG